jgi:drug/metabolite transporter (DMT)-like permease
MENLNLHKQRLITVIVGILGLIFLFLPWQKVTAQGYEGTSHMGFTIWGGIICAIAIVVVIADSIFIGDKIRPFDKQGKIIAIACFAIMFLMTIIVLIASSDSEQLRTNLGDIVEVKKSAGIGAWLSLVLELVGLAWVSGILDKLNLTTTPSSVTHSGPPPPPPPPPPAR